MKKTILLFLMLFMINSVCLADKDYFITNPGELLESFEDASDWNLAGTGSVADDSDNYKELTQGVKLTATGGSQANITKTVNWNLSSATNFVLWVYVDNSDNFYQLVLYLSTDNSDAFSNYYICTTETLFAGWNRIVLLKSDFTEIGNGSCDWSLPMLRFRLRAQGDTGDTVNLTFDEFRHSAVHQPVVILTFDDGARGQWDHAYDMMLANDQVGVANIIGNGLDFGTQIDSMDDSSVWTLAGTGSKEDESDHIKEGGGAIRLTATGGNQANITADINVNMSAMDDNDRTNLNMWVYVPDKDLVDNFIIYLTSSAVSFTNYYISQTVSNLQTGWNRVALSSDMFTEVGNGSEDWANAMKKIRIRFKAVGTSDSYVVIDDLSFSTGNNAIPLNGLHTMYDNGWDIANHSFSHPHMRVISAARRFQESTDNSEFLRDLGFPKSCKIFAYPYGEYNSYVINSVKDRHVFGRGSYGNFDDNYLTHFEIDGNSEFVFPGHFSILATHNVSDATEQIDDCIARGSLKIFIFHNFVSSPTGTEWTPAKFQDFSDYLKTKQDSSGVKVLSISDYLKMINPHYINNSLVISGITIN